MTGNIDTLTANLRFSTTV